MVKGRRYLEIFSMEELYFSRDVEGVEIQSPGERVSFEGRKGIWTQRDFHSLGAGICERTF